MALMDLFKKKVTMGSEMQMPPMHTPLSEVMQLQTQGLTNNQIIQTLQRQGYNPTQIYDALAQSEAKKSIEPMQPMPQSPMQEQSQSMHEEHPTSETLVEQIVDEKWKELQGSLVKINEWKDAMSSRMDKLEQSMVDVKSDLDGLHKAIVSRIGEYDKTLLDVGTEIKAMEKVFQKVLPELTGNIQELSRITKNVKEEKPSKK